MFVLRSQSRQTCITELCEAKSFPKVEKSMLRAEASIRSRIHAVRLPTEKVASLLAEGGALYDIYS